MPTLVGIITAGSKTELISLARAGADRVTMCDGPSRANLFALDTASDSPIIGTIRLCIQATVNRKKIDATYVLPPKGLQRPLGYLSETPTSYQNGLAMRNTADETDGKAIAV
jgi:hypothetical protein